MFPLGTWALRAKPALLILPGCRGCNLRVRISLGAEQETTLGFPSKMRFNKGVLCCAQSGPTLCDHRDGSRPDSSIHGSLQARILEWIAFPTPGDLLNPGIKAASSVSPTLTGGCFTSVPWEARGLYYISVNSVIQLCPTLCDPMDYSMLGFPVHHQLPELTQNLSIQLVMPSNHLILCGPFLLLPSVFSSESVFRIRWPKYWSFSSSISLSNEYSGLISFKIDWFDLLAVQGALESLLL